MTNQFLSFRVSQTELDALDAIATQRGASRSEIARSALALGVPLLAAARSINVTRMLILLEYTQAALDLIITREHADFAEKLPLIAQERMDTYHA